MSLTQYMGVIGCKYPIYWGWKSNLSQISKKYDAKNHLIYRKQGKIAGWRVIGRSTDSGEPISSQSQPILFIHASDIHYRR